MLKIAFFAIAEYFKRYPVRYPSVVIFCLFNSPMINVNAGHVKVHIGLKYKFHKSSKASAIAIIIS